MVDVIEKSRDSRAGSWAAFSSGLGASLAVVIGYIPIAFSFGVVASREGMTVTEAVWISGAIYSGAGQLAALSLLAGGVSLWISIVTVLLMNARHVFYGPALLERAAVARRVRWPWLWGYGLTDEVFATASVQLNKPGVRWSEWWMGGIGLGPFLGWLVGTFAGVKLGTGWLQAYPAIDAGLGFLLPALFLSLILSGFQRSSLRGIAVAGGVAATFAWCGAGAIGIGVSMVAGALMQAWFGPLAERQGDAV